MKRNIEKNFQMDELQADIIIHQTTSNCLTGIILLIFLSIGLKGLVRIYKTWSQIKNNPVETASLEKQQTIENESPGTASWVELPGRTKFFDD